jgi:hypothetical protein
MPRGSAVQLIRRNKHYKRLKRDIDERALMLPADLAVAHTLADMRHVCDDLSVDYEIADRIGGIYYSAELRGSIR